MAARVPFLAEKLNWNR